MSRELKVPEVGESIHEVEIGEWLKEEGETVEQDEPVVTLESEKSTLDLPAPETGKLVKIKKKAGETAEVGEVIALLEPATPEGAGEGAQGDREEPEAQGDREEPEDRGTEGTQRAREAGRGDRGKKREKGRKTGKDSEEEQEKGPPPGDRAVGEDRGKATAKEDEGAGREHDREKGRESSPDDEKSRQARREDRAGEGESADRRRTQAVRMSPMRRHIAKRLVEGSREAVLLTTFNEIDMTEVQALRREQGEAFRERHGVKLGLMSFFVRAAVEALQAFPGLNARVRDDEIIYHEFQDVGIAVARGEGLVVPVLRDAQTRSFAQIEEGIRDFARRAESGRLEPDELSAGTFTITNGGVFGSLLSTPVVNPPQSGILGLHAIQDRPVARDGEVVIRPMMYVALSYDHRIVDGREAVQFLVKIKDLVEHPARMLLQV